MNYIHNLREMYHEFFSFPQLENFQIADIRVTRLVALGW